MTIASLDRTEAARAKALAWIGQGPKRLLIDGQWVDAASGKTFEILNPATDELLCQVSEADSADVDAAVAGARKAFGAASWSGISPHARTRTLLAIADRIEANIDEPAAIESLDNGMPFGFAQAAVTATVDIFHYYAGWCSKVPGTTIPSDGSTLIYTLREPLGVCGQIIPWNVPVLMAAIKFANGLCRGNTLIPKPAELACLTSIRLAELVQETDLPPGVTNVLPGCGPTAGGVWTKSLSTAHKVSEGIRSGTVWVNCYGVIDPAVGFGGTKMSGYGWKGGREHVESFL
ncbi:MAG: aldehyde dehydrogenase family protein [Burkholderiaceae bacterium]